MQPPQPPLYLSFRPLLIRWRISSATAAPHQWLLQRRPLLLALLLLLSSAPLCTATTAFAEPSSVSAGGPLAAAPAHHGGRLVRMAEKNLIQELLRDYDKKSRPVVDTDPDGGTPKILRPREKGANSSKIPIQQITVQFGLRLVQILDLNEMEQVLTISVISLYQWVDYHLRWEPEEESGIKLLHIPTSKLWLPDIALYNYADERLEERRDSAAKVHHNGTVEWHPMAIYKSACEIKIRYFPFDKQVCWLKFGPWTYDGWRVNITYYRNMTAFDVEGMVDSPEWEILNHSAMFKEQVYPCCPEPYVDITFWLWIRRNTAFSTLILILPCCLLSSLTLVLFWLPPETPAKMVLGMNIFVAFFLLMLLLEGQTPSASDSFPLIGQYYCLNMGIITLSTFLSVIVVNFHFRGDNRQEVPRWLKLAIERGARLLFVTLSAKPQPQQQQKPQQQQQQTQLQLQQIQQPQQQLQLYSAPPYHYGRTNGASVPPDLSNRYYSNCQQQPLMAPALLAMEPMARRKLNTLAKDLRDIVKALRYIQRLHEGKERVGRTVQEWRSVAMVLDRLFFVIYFVTIVMSIVVYYPKEGNEIVPGVIPDDSPVS